MWNLPVLLSVFLSVLATAIFFYKRRHNYWKSRGIYQLPQKFITGNEDTNRIPGLQFMDHYRSFKTKGLKFGGIYMFTQAHLVIVDLDLIKNIMVKDFDHFADRQNDIPLDNDPLANHLFNMAGEGWRGLRMKLTPTFTSGKMKMMYQTLVACTYSLKEMLSDYATKNSPVDIKDVVGRFTTDIIGNCAFGLECNSMKDPDSEFRKYGKKSFEFTTFQKIKFIIIMNFIPVKIFKLLKLKIMSSDVESFFMNTVKEIVDYREKHQVARKDFMHLLLQLKNRGALNDDGEVGKSEKPGKSLLSFEEIAAQCFVFFLAGFETSSTVMTFALLEMALNQEVQSKLRDEIQKVLKKHDGQLTYECVNEMKYLDCVAQESMRKYPPLSVLQRGCTKEYKIPGTDVVLEKGTKIIIPVMGIHMDEEYFPNPEKFDPERFNDENRARIPHFAFLPFGEGPRNCIGLRFGLLQTKVGLATIIKNYKVTVNEKTKLPFEFDTMSFVTSIKEGVWLNMEKLQEK